RGYVAFVNSFMAIFGWIRPGLVESALPMFAAWLANPVFWLGLGLLIFRRPKSAVAAGIACLFLASAIVPMIGKISTSPAYCTWHASFALLAVGSAIFAFSRPTQVAQDDETDATYAVDEIDERIRPT